MILPIRLKERNILQVYLNKDDQLMCGQDYIDIKQLRQKPKEFIANVNDAEKLPEKHKRMWNCCGTYMVTEKHVISLQNDRGIFLSEHILACRTNWWLHIMN